MPRSRRTSSAKTSRYRYRNRHGRSLRSSVTGPFLPPLRTRIDLFEMTVASTADYLKGVWPEELSKVVFEIGAVPLDLPAEGAPVERWSVIGNRIILYRLPIQRMSKLHRDDELHKRMIIESCVFRAVAELLGKDPWDLAPDRFRHF
ncbi:metallopeptidase family protein [Subtercola endophyticus]|uniref:metallopeptidase family protein n=1 Tax=Subtercola endophyticus TaxID=2895559 RepID=UPI001E4D37C3|nr:metallopeptidase family protein [Subtercola endophyticus]UFS57726.1 metallopeptidase family protein [Subtercola endophyticus]